MTCWPALSNQSSQIPLSFYMFLQQLKLLILGLQSLTLNLLLSNTVCFSHNYVSFPKNHPLVPIDSSKIQTINRSTASLSNDLVLPRCNDSGA